MPEKPKKLAGTAVKSILGEVHQTLTKHGVTQPVQMRFGAADVGPCWEYRLVEDSGGNPVYQWVQVPCQ